MKIRHAIANDSVAIFKLANQLHASMSVERDEFRSTFERMLQRPECACLVLCDSEKIVGYISGYIRPVLIQGGNVAFVDEIVIESSMRGQSLGTSLMSHFETWAQSEKCALVGLATGGAKSFYEKLGYQSKAGYFKKYLN